MGPNGKGDPEGVQTLRERVSAYLANEAGGGGTGRRISDAIRHSFATLIHSMMTRNGFGVPSCPA